MALHSFKPNIEGQGQGDPAGCSLAKTVTFRFLKDPVSRQSDGKATEKEN